MTGYIELNQEEIADLSEEEQQKVRERVAELDEGWKEGLVYPAHTCLGYVMGGPDDVGFKGAPVDIRWVGKDAPRRQTFFVKGEVP